MPTPPATDRHDPRTVRSRQRAIDAALELLREHGVRGVTIEAVSAHSGIAKTTLYRQFADRDELFFAAIESMKSNDEIPVQGGVVADVERWLLAFARALRTSDFAPLVPAVIEVGERSERGRQLAAEFGERRRASLGRRLRTAVDDGELPAGFDVDTAVSQLVGPLFYRRFLARQPMPAAFVRQVARSVLASAASSC
jgi:AcrR family transcriptional regulator